MNASQRKKSKLLKPTLQQSLKAIDEGDIKSAREGLEWIKVHNELYNIHNSRHKFKWSVLIIIASMAIISLSMYIHIPSAHIVSSANVSLIHFNLASPCSTSTKIITGNILIRGMTDFTSLQENQRILDYLKGKSEVEIIGPGLKINEIIIDSTAEVDIGYKENKLSIYLKKGTLTLNVDLRKCNIICDSDTLKVDIPANESPESLTFYSRAGEMRSESLFIEDPQDFTIKNASLDSIKYSDEDPPGSSRFTSTIIKGQVKILETDQEVLLEEKDFLAISLYKPNKLNIRYSGNELVTSLEARVGSCETGGPAFRKELKPTIISYLYYSKKIGLLWASLLFVVGLLWSIKNAFLKNEN